MDSICIDFIYSAWYSSHRELDVKQSMKQRNKAGMFIAWLMVILWMAFIFYMSAQPAEVSNGMSIEATKIIIKAVNSIYPLDIETSTLQTWIGRFNHYVRKLGHVTEYFVLAIFAVNAFKRSGSKASRLWLYSFLLCFSYAVSDEMHQYFGPGRGPGLIDVLRDSGGAILGMGIYRLGSMVKPGRK
ncbi:VanZ family protein [Lutispora sp.]|uniref:VanZ family protein n=1 Tax=Lutispora sp. TaxID=2828727 RepID=UPI002B218963|nr:VanZ family protein [Lutispora sp.]MEA4960077.1 VanZ family protein [Lutispora sp.]